MPPDDDLDIEQDIEPVEVADEADASQEAEQPASAQSSSAEDVSETEGEDLLSVVRDVVDKSRKDPTAASSATGAETGSAAGDQSTSEGEAEKPPPFHKHPAWIRQQTMLSEARSKAQANEQDAQRYRNVDKFVADQGLSPPEAQDLLVIGGLIKTNPVEAWRRMAPVVQKVLMAAGEVLPDDLRRQVDEGQISLDSAMTVSRSRAELNAHRAQLTFQQQRTEQQRESAEADRMQQEATLRMETAQAWAEDRRTKDPNFSAKESAILDEVKRLQGMGWVPTTPDAVTEQLRRAYASVNAKLQPRTPTPAKPAIRPVTGGQVNGGSRAEPQSTMDHVTRVLEKRRRAA